MARHILTSQEQERVIRSIQQAEQNTSGEIRLHVEPTCAGDPYERAQQVFGELGMHNTERKNGVLFYVAYSDHKIAVIGDSGIHEKVTDSFWKEEIEALTRHFGRGAFCDGLCMAIEAAGQKLKQYFPYQANDRNELSNDISFGGDHA